MLQLTIHRIFIGVFNCFDVYSWKLTSDLKWRKEYTKKKPATTLNEFIDKMHCDELCGMAGRFMAKLVSVLQMQCNNNGKRNRFQTHLADSFFAQLMS